MDSTMSGSMRTVAGKVAVETATTELPRRQVHQDHQAPTRLALPVAKRLEEPCGDRGLTERGCVTVSGTTEEEIAVPRHLIVYPL